MCVWSFLLVCFLDFHLQWDGCAVMCTHLKLGCRGSFFDNPSKSYPLQGFLAWDRKWQLAELHLASTGSLQVYEPVGEVTATNPCVQRMGTEWKSLSSYRSLGCSVVLFSPTRSQSDVSMRCWETAKFDFLLPIACFPKQDLRRGRKKNPKPKHPKTPQNLLNYFCLVKAFLC